jgi:two-component system phosphate regulon sensor histidine kinase PhoR
MKIRIRWKLMASYLFLVLLMGAVFFGYLNHAMEKQLTGEIREGLLSEARLARLMASREIGELRKDAHPAAVAIGREIKARVTIITINGQVVGDSEVAVGELANLDNHAGRPEVRRALLAGQGDAIRYSATLRTDMLYVALPFDSAGREKGIIRLALPLSSVGKARASLHALLGASLALAVLLSLLLSFILSNVTSRTLRTMAATAVRIGRGEFGTRIPVTSNDELGELAEVLNDMAVLIEEQLERMSAEKTQLDTILRGMGEGLMVADASGTITLVNPAFHTLFAIKDEVEGQPLINISRHPDLHDSFRLVITTGTERLEEIILPPPTEKTVLTHWVPLLEDDELQGVVAVFHDISDSKRLDKIRRDFVANLSHELRTPVTIIKGYAEALLTGILASDPDQAARFVTIIHNHSERLASLIGDLLTLSQLEAGNLSLELTRTDLAAAVDRVVASMAQAAQAKEMTIDCSGLAEAPVVLADPGRLEQVLINLLDNGIKYTPAGGAITFSVENAGDRVKIGIKDTGIGIPARDLPRIFERFYRVDAARSRDEGGTGLGLAIVKHIIQLHNGAVSVESTPGRGTTIFFTLPKG